MNIGLLNLEAKYKNFALEKLRLYHHIKGDCVQDYFALNKYDKVYVSSIFSSTKKTIVPENAICGGTGFDVASKLPPDVESIKPHLNFGFTTRGCIRKCSFCIVPAKEGYIRKEGDLLDLWDGVARDIVLFDNNILALPSHFALVCEQAKANRLRLDFNQGLDHRLLTPEIIGLMKSILHIEYRFAFDHPSYLDSVDKAITLLQSRGINRCLWYVLVAFDTTFQQDLERLNYLRGRGQTAYVQVYNNRNTSLYSALSRWVNQHHLFKAMTWEQFLEHPDSHRRHIKSLVSGVGNSD